MRNATQQAEFLLHRVGRVRERTPGGKGAYVDGEEEGNTQIKDNYDYREKEVFIQTNPRAERPNLHFEK